MSESFDDSIKINAIFLLQRLAFEKQLQLISSYLDTTGTPKSKPSLPTIPPILNRRQHNDEQKRILDDVELTLLSILDSNGYITMQCQVEELLLLMTRVIKSDQRILLLRVITDKMTPERSLEFMELGGLRLLKRWMRLAEEDNNAAELTALVVACKKLPFHGRIVKDTEIGKTIKKLLKFKGFDGRADTSKLHAEVKALMDFWMEQLKAGSAATKPPAAVPVVALEAAGEQLVNSLLHNVQSCFVETHSSPLPALPSATAPPSPHSSTTSSTSAATTQRAPSNASKAPSVAESKASLGPSLTLKPVDDKPAAVLSRQITKETLPATSTAVGKRAAEAVASQHASTSAAASASASASPSPGSAHAVVAAATVPGPTAAGLVRVPRERRTGESMAEGARKFLASKGGVLPTSSSDSVDSRGAGEVDILGASLAVPSPSSQTTSSSSSAHALSASESKLQSSLAALAAKSNRSAASAVVEPAQPLRSAMKRKLVDGEVPSASASESDAATPVPAKKAKLSVKWADHTATGSLRQVHTFEVEKIRSSVANYKTHRDLVKRERQLEKDANVHKISDAMQAVGEWTKPLKLTISLELQEYAPGPLVSAEKALQTKRLLHVLEARYLDDSLIPSDPDPAPAWDAADAATPLLVPWRGAGETEMEESSSSLEMEDEDLMLAGLPECLRGLEPELLLMLVQDEANIQAILNPDGSVNVYKVEQLRNGTLHSRPDMLSHASYRATGYDDAPYSHTSASAYSPSHRDDYYNPIEEYSPTGYDSSRRQADYGQTSSRFDDRSAPRSASWDTARSSIPSSSSSSSSSSAVPVAGGLQMAPSLFSSPAMGSSLPLRSEQPVLQFGIRDSSSRREVDAGAAARKKFPTTKAATPCRFFGTAKGCQMGDKCAFGHFAGSADPPRGLAGRSSSSRVSSGASKEKDQFGRDLR